MNDKYARNSSYRNQFLNAVPPVRGKYRCVYCGRRVRPEKMQVDHVVAVHLAQKGFLPKLLVPKGVNDISNLAPACRRCNRRKGSKGGLWIIRGRFWRVCLPIYTVLRLACLAGVAFVALAAFGWPPAVDMLSGLLSELTTKLPQII